MPVEIHGFCQEGHEKSQGSPDSKSHQMDAQPTDRINHNGSRKYHRDPIAHDSDELDSETSN